MINKKVNKAMNDQIREELASAYLYLSMAAYCDSINLPGCAHWLLLQAQEEVEHAMKFYGFLCDRDGRVILQAVDQPPVEFKSPLDIFEKVLEHEKKVTALIDKLYALTVEENDHASQVFLQWFVTEQVEEEKGASAIIETLRMVKDDSSALLIVDRELAGRQASA